MTPDVGMYFTGMSAILPELVLCAGVVLLLLGEAFAEKGLRRDGGWGALIILVCALVCAIVVSSEKETLFVGMIVVDPFASFFRILAIVAGILGVLIALHSDEVTDARSGEYFSMFLALVVGMSLMASASDLLMIYIAIELVSLMSYVLAGFRRKDRKSSEGALKYVIYGGAASGVMLFGFSLLYGLTGHTQLSLINEQVHLLSQANAAIGLTGEAAAVPVALTAGIILSFGGFAYKIAAVPFHMWSPDVYEGAPTPFTAFLSTGPKAAGFAALIRFFVVGFADNAHYANSHLLGEITRLPWPHLLVIISLVTMTVGNFAAIGQTNIKRFLAYSSIAHAGYSLIGIAAFSQTGAASVLLYMAFYVVMNIGAFYAVVWFRRHTQSDLIEDFKGLGYRAPLVGVTLAICLFSLTGLPPFAGFIGKFYLFSAALDRGAAYPAIAACAPAALESGGFVLRMGCRFAGGSMFMWLAIIAALNSAVSLYYYARVVRKLFLERPTDETPLPIDGLSKGLLAAVSAVLVIGGIYWQPLWKASRNAIDFQRPTIAEVTPKPTPSIIQAQKKAAAQKAKEAEKAKKAEKSPETASR